MIVIDRTNYTAYRPKAGDLVLNDKNEPLGEVIRLTRRGKILVRSLRYEGLLYRLRRRGDSSGQHWESWFEDGGRLGRPLEGKGK